MAFNSIGREGFWDYTLDDAQWLSHIKNLRLQSVIDRFESYDASAYEYKEKE
jgi:hypothetical protein